MVVCCLGVTPWMYFQSFAGVLPRGFQEESCVCITAVMFYNRAVVVSDCAFPAVLRLR